MGKTREKKEGECLIIFREKVQVTIRGEKGGRPASQKEKEKNGRSSRGGKPGGFFHAHKKMRLNVCVTRGKRELVPRTWEKEEGGAAI